MRVDTNFKSLDDAKLVADLLVGEVNFLREQGGRCMTINSAFEYLKPSDKQAADMALARESAMNYARELDSVLPEGPDKTYLMRKLREVAMWANVAITRNADGSPRA